MTDLIGVIATIAVLTVMLLIVCFIIYGAAYVVALGLCAGGMC
jgi:hypothetical protein